MTPGNGRDRISTLKKTRNYDDEQELGNAWNFPIGWNRSANAEASEPRDARFLGNQIQTAKYTLCNFAPYNLLHQLSKGPNIYYLLICLLQMIKPISITGGSPTNAPPLLFLMFVSMVKDFFEDNRRRKADKSENNRLTVLIEPQDTEPNEQLQHLIVKPIVSEIPWHSVKTGQIVKIFKNEFFPADLVLLATSAPKNMCFVETKNLDGETNLKHKIAPKELQAFEDEVQLTQCFEGTLTCEPPNDQIYKFEGLIKTQTGERISLSHENFLLRGSSLRNTDWVLGVVTYTGHDTRIMRNSVSSKQKFSKLEKLITKSIIIIFLIECLLVFVASTWATVWNDIYDTSTDQYLALGRDQSW